MKIYFKIVFHHVIFINFSQFSLPTKYYCRWLKLDAILVKVNLTEINYIDYIEIIFSLK